MTMADTPNRTAPYGASKGLRSRFAALRVAIADVRSRRASYRRTFIELDSLSDRELADIGIGRCDIRRIAREELSKD